MNNVKRTVYVVGGDGRISDMFLKHPDYMLTPVPLLADIHVFIGGADVNPELYGQRRHRTTGISEHADKRDLSAWQEALSDADNPLKVGICRGAQFLNVMNGGKMWQNVNNHNIGRHKAYDLTGVIEPDTGEPYGEITVTSTHHQMMRESPDGEVLMIAHCANSYEDDTQHIEKSRDYDTEVVWYPKTNSLCFQPHPEYLHEETHDYFFKLLNKVLN